MDDDKGLELSLGLPCGGSASNSKDRSGNSADGRTDTDERTSKIVNEFKNFLNAGIPQSFQRTDPVKSQEPLFSNLSQSAAGGHVSGNAPLSGDKRKHVFDESSSQKKQETETLSSDIQDKGKSSHISITTDEGSTADNEDVADSEAEGSTSRIVSHREDGSRTPVGSNSSSQVSKEVHGNVITGAPRFTVQPRNSMNVPYSITIKEAPSVSAPSTSTFPLSNITQAIPSTNGERPGPRTTSPGNVTMSFGYSPVQLPVLDKDSPWGAVARSQSLHSPYAGRVISTSVPTQVANPSPSEATRPDVRPSEQSNGQNKQLVTEEASSSQSEDDGKGRANNFPSEYPSIRPGIAGDVKFGGSGSFPNLPWVSTTGPGPNGKTISGVTYKYNATQIKIVCACHGTHMSPDEFVRHAAEDQPIAVAAPGFASTPSSNPAASART